MFPAHLAFLAAHHWRSARKCPHHHAGHAHQDHPAHQAHLEMLATPDQTVNLVLPARMVAMDHPAQLDPTDHPVPLARTETRDLPAHPPSLFHPPLVTPDLLAKLAHPAHLVKTVPQDPMADLAQLATRDHPDLLAHLATMVLQATRDHLAQMDPRESRVSAPNTAPPMVVSSSKTEQGDKRRLHPTFFRICYSDEKPVVCLSIVFIIIFLFNGQFPSQSTILNTAAASPVISFGAF